MRRSLPALCIALCLLLTNGCWDGISRATAATVLSVKGRVVFGSGQRDDLVPITLKSRIHQGNMVRSSEGASLDLQLVPGALVRLTADSEITVEELKLIKDGNETADGMRNRSARIRMTRGRILLLFSKPDTSGSHLAVLAHHVTVNPDSSCLFSVWSDGTSTRVTCARDKVIAFSAAEAPVTIAAGYFQQWPAGGLKPLVAAETAAGQIDVRDSIEAGERLLEQAVRLQNRRPF